MSGRRHRARGAAGAALLVLAMTAAASPLPTAPASAASAPVEDIRDIRGPRAETPEWVLPAAIGAVLLAAILGYGVWRRRRRRLLAPLTPLERAERRLAEVRRWMTAADAPRFAVEVSAIVREYIEQRFGVGATLLTSEEFLRRMLASSDATLLRQRGRLLSFLQQCDLAKFAGAGLTLDAMEALHADACAFVRETAGREEADAALPAT